MMEQSQGSADAVLGLMRHEELQRQRTRIEGLRLGGMVAVAAGAGVMPLLYFLVKDQPVFWVGLMPVLVGLVLLRYGFFVTPKPTDPGEVPRQQPPR